MELLFNFFGPLIRIEALRHLGHFIITPLVAWLAMNLVFLGWHVPAAYDFALEHERWHEFEHLVFSGDLDSCSGGRLSVRGLRARFMPDGCCWCTWRWPTL